MIHLHLHSEYSLRDSIVKIDSLLERVGELEAGAVALTDHGNLSGILEFYVKCHEADLVPILGMEAYMVRNIAVRVRGDKRYHLVLLAKNEIGYKNLIRLACDMGRDGFYYVPRADFKMLEEYREGLIALTACCISSVVYMLGDDELAACWIIKTLRRLFGDDLFLEIMPHNLKEQKQHNLLMYNLGQKYDLPLVATQDVHYLREEDKEAHDILMKIQGRDPYNIDSLFLGTREEIYEAFIQEHRYLPKGAIVEAMANTETVAARIEDCNIPLSAFDDYPTFKIEEVAA